MNLPVDRWLADLRLSSSPERSAGSRVILAVSGGADSVALASGWHEIHAGSAQQWIIATFDHGLRPESANDAQFVADLARKQNVPFFLGRPTEPINAKSEHSLESAARKARYHFLAQLAIEQKAATVLTAHTADDQMETILFRLVRGTGLAGLAGIPRRRSLVPGVELFRPLLTHRRASVEGYLAEIGQAFVDDSSNRDLRFVRNRIRHLLLPLIRDEIHPGVDQALLRLAEVARTEWQTTTQKLAEWCQHVVTESGADYCIVDAGKFNELDPRAAGRVMRELVTRMGGPLQQVGWKSIHHAMQVAKPGGPPRVQWPGGVSFERCGAGDMRISRAFHTPPSGQVASSSAGSVSRE
jgi:tRNA(Ile)-lysidine synthase